MAPRESSTSCREALLKQGRFVEALSSTPSGRKHKAPGRSPGSKTTSSGCKPTPSQKTTSSGRQGKTTSSVSLWRRDGERDQVTALAPWPRSDGTWDLYVAAFSSRFEVDGGVLPRGGGAVQWLPGHRLRMGMARAVGDFDADGAAEVAVGRLYGDAPGADGDLRVIQEDGKYETVPTLRGVRALAAADLEGDGRAELLFGDGWHKAYGKKARFRPSIARYADASGWTVELVQERADQYAVERIGLVGR